MEQSGYCVPITDSLTHLDLTAGHTVRQENTQMPVEDVPAHAHQ